MLFALLILVPLAAAVDAKVWQQTEILPIYEDDGPNAVAVVDGQLAVVFIRDVSLVYGTYNPALDTWALEPLPVEIPVDPRSDNYERDLRLVDWDGRPAIAWNSDLYDFSDHPAGFDISFAYRDAGGWHVETVTGNAIAGFNLVIGPGPTPYICSRKYFSSTDKYRLALYHRTGVNSWVSEWITGEGTEAGWSALAFDAGLPRVVYTTSENGPGGYVSKLWYSWKGADGAWHPLEVRAINEKFFYHPSLLFTSGHRPFITATIAGVESQFYGVYDNGNPTNPWTEDLPFNVGDGLCPDGVMERRQDGDYLHLAYYDSRYNAIGYVLRSPIMFGTGQPVASDAWFPTAQWGATTYTSPATGPHIALFHGTPAVVHLKKVYPEAPRLVCSRLVDPLPTVTGLNPSQVRAGTLMKVIRVTGSGFTSTDTVVRADGTMCDTGYASPTELQFVEMGDSMAAPGGLEYRVRTADGRQTPLVGLTVSTPPAPHISQVSPAMGPSGGTLTVTVTGTGFYGSTPEELQPGGDVDVFLTNPGYDAVPGTTTAWTPTLITATFTLPAAGTWNVMVVNPDNQWDLVEGGFTVTPSPMLVVPGGAGLPWDTDHDGKYEDVNGNGRKDFADVVLYFNQMSWIAANEPVSAFDYNGNGRIDFADVVWLFNRL